MASAPSSSTDRFVRPSLLWFLAFDGGIAAMGAMSVSEKAYDTIAESSPVPVPPRPRVQAMFAGTILLHIIEAKITYGMAKRRGMDKSAVRWGVSALVVGFPTMLKLRKVSKLDAAVAAVAAVSS